MGDVPINWQNVPDALGYAGNALTMFGNARLAPQYQTPLPYNPMQQWQMQFAQLQADKMKREAEKEKSAQAAWTAFGQPQMLPEGVAGPPGPSQAQQLGLNPQILSLLQSSEKGPELAASLVAEQLKPKAPVIVPEGGTAINPLSGTPMFTGPAKLTELQREAAALYPTDPDKQRQFIEATRQKPLVNMGESLAKPIGEIAKETRDAAKGAIDTRNTTNRIREAMEGANLGPAATLQSGLERVAARLGIAGKDTEAKLANTRSVIKGLSELTLSGRKALKGQGQVSDYEGKLLERAVSGDIDTLTPGELNVILDVADRVAEQQYGEHETTLQAIQGNEAHKGLAPFYKVRPMPERYQPKIKAPSGATLGGRPRATNPQTGETIEWDGRLWVPVK